MTTIIIIVIAVAVLAAMGSKILSKDSSKESPALAPDSEELSSKKKKKKEGGSDTEKPLKISTNMNTSGSSLFQPPPETPLFTGRKELLKEINLAEEIIELAEINQVALLLPEDYKIVTDYQSTIFENKTAPDFSKELQLDLGEKTINQFEDLFKDIKYVFWNGPLGAYDHPACSYYAEGSLELAKLLFQMALSDSNFSVVIGGGDSAAILNKIGITELKKMIKVQIEKQFPSTINRNQVSIDFLENDSYQLWNYFSSNFFVSTGGGASLEFLQGFLKGKAKGDMASYLPGTATLMELCEI